MTQTIEQLQARVRELEEENARLKAECDDIKQVQFPRKLEAVAAGWKTQLAASQLHAEQLWEVIEEFVEVCTPKFCACEPDVGYKCRACNPIEAVKAARELLALPRDTSALDAYVAEKVKACRELDEKQIAYLFEERNTLTRQRDNLMQQAQQHAMEARTANATLNEIYQLVSRATGEKANWNGAQPVREKLESLTRQRDLAVEALKWLKLIFTDSEMSQERDPELWMPTVEEAIKESEGK